MLRIQGYLARWKSSTPPRPPVSTQAGAYGRVLEGCVFLSRRYPLCRGHPLSGEPGERQCLRNEVPQLCWGWSLKKIYWRSFKSFGIRFFPALANISRFRGKDPKESPACFRIGKRTRESRSFLKVPEVLKQANTSPFRRKRPPKTPAGRCAFEVLEVTISPSIAQRHALLKKGLQITLVRLFRSLRSFRFFELPT